MSNERIIIPQDRVVERGRGCWNCKSYENAELARAHWKECRAAEEQAIIAKGGDPVLVRLGDMENPQAKQVNARFVWMDNLINNGQAGMCMKGKAPGTFVHHKYLCDGWTGKEGSSVATFGHPIDKLPEELVEDAESRAKAPLDKKGS